MSTSTAPRIDVYARVTETIIASLEEVRRPWHQPWTDVSQSWTPKIRAGCPGLAG